MLFFKRSGPSFLNQITSIHSATQCLGSSPSRLFSQRSQAVLSPARAGQTLLPSRSIIELRGQDAPQFLQGLTTANIPSRASGYTTGLYSAFLNAQGRLLQDVFVYPLSPSSPLFASLLGETRPDHIFLIEVDTNQASNLVNWLRKYKLRSKVSLRLLSSDEVAVSSVWDDDIPSGQLKHAIDESSAQTNAICIIDSRAPRLGVRLLHRKDDAFPGIPIVQPNEYTLRRYLNGTPEGQDELSYGSALVHESCIDYMGGVDFRKGCYVGQELVIRTQHTGVVRKRILPCILYDATEPPPELVAYDSGLQLSVSAGEIPFGADVKGVFEGVKARSKGKWIAGVGNIGLALCRLEDVVGLGPTGERDEGWNSKTQWRLDWERPENDGQNVRIKAFVPDWWSQRRSEIRNSEHV